MKYLYGCIKNNKLKIAKEVDYYEDNEVVINVCGSNYNQEDYLKLKDLYKKYNEKFSENIDDFIAVYLYDKLNKKMIIIRDRTATQNVYYYLDNENNLYFSNDFMTLINQYKIKKEINIDALTMYFRNYFVNPPETIIKNVYKLEHGHYLKYENNELENKVYYNIIEVFNNIKKENNKNELKDFDAVKKQLENKLTEKIKKYLSEDENTGFYISGGIDSSLTASIASKISDKPINTYSIGFHDKVINEADRSKKIAEYLKANHHELYITEKEAQDIIYKIPEYYSEMFADPSQVATVLLNEYAKKNNVKIAITGDAADQLFCGATMYDTMYKVQKAKRFVNPFNIYLPAKIFKNRKLRYLFSNKDKHYVAQCEMNDFEVLLDGLFIQSENNRFKQEKYIKTNNLQEKRMILDYDTYLCSRVVNKMYTAARYNDINVRSAFLSKDIIEYSFEIPHQYKYYNKNKKYILKQLLYEYVPESLFSKKKHGFSIPTKQWLKTVFYKDLERFSTKEYLDKQNIFNYDKVKELINNIDNKKYTVFIWEYFIFQLWYDKYIN